MGTSPKIYKIGDVGTSPFPLVRRQADCKTVGQSYCWFALDPSGHPYIAQWARKWKRKTVVADLTNPIISAGQGLISAGLTSRVLGYAWFLI